MLSLNDKQRFLAWCKDTFEIAHANHNSILSMEGIRGFAVFLVFLVHYVTLMSPWLTPTSLTANVAHSIHSIGNVGVDLFFVLSGFLIYGMLMKRKTYFPDYLLRRIQRIYPTFVVVLAAYIILSIIFPSQSKLPDGWKDTLQLIMQNFFLLPGLFNIEAIVTVSWSLSYEFFYYLVMPVLISVLCLRNWSPMQRIGFFCILSVLLFIYFVNFGGPIRLLMFVPGILLYEVISNKLVNKLPPLGLPALLTALVAVVLFKAMNLSDWVIYITLYFLFFIFCLECFVNTGLTQRIFSYTYLRWLGNISYSYYLIHGLTLKAAFLVMSIIYPADQSNTSLFWLLWIPMFIFTLIPSALLFVFIEKPYSLSPRKRHVDAAVKQVIPAPKTGDN